MGHLRGRGGVFVCVMLVTGTTQYLRSHMKQLRGDEFYESKEAFRFALRNSSAVLASPLLILAFVALMVVFGLIFSLLGAIPAAGEIFVGLLAILGFIASLFIVYLLVFLSTRCYSGPASSALLTPTHSTPLFEVFS